jgi:hypothetical protein
MSGNYFCPSCAIDMQRDGHWDHHGEDTILDDNDSYMDLDGPATCMVCGNASLWDQWSIWDSATGSGVPAYVVARLRPNGPRPKGMLK